MNVLHPYRSERRPLTGPMMILLTALGSSTNPTSAGVYPSARLQVEGQKEAC